MAVPNTSPYKNLSARLQDTGVLKDNPTLLKELQDKVSESMTKLAKQPRNGGHPFLFALAAPKPHYLRDSLSSSKGDFTTAATDGKVFFWHPDFLNKLTPFEISIVMMHEGYHVLFDHCRRGIGRNPRIWNWAVDYVVNSVIEEDHETQGRKGDLWFGNLGTPLPLQTLLDNLDGKSSGKLPVCEDGNMIFADRSVYGRSPESIYDEIMGAAENSPNKCPDCGSFGLSSDPGDEFGDGSGDESGDGSGNGSGDESGDGSGEGSCCDVGNCKTCGAIPDSLDEHIMPDVTREEAIRDNMRAADIAQKMIGSVPTGVQEAIGELEKPTLTWEDLVRNAVKRKIMDVGNRNDYKRYRRRPFSFPIPMYMPRKHSHAPKVLCMLDTSGSMGQDDIIYGVSQLKALGDGIDCLIVPCDSKVYWEDAVHVKNMDDLNRTKVTGRGGTIFNEFFHDFPKRVGTEFDVIVVLTDGYVGKIPMELMPPIDVVWVVTSPNIDYKPSFGRVAPIRSSRK